MRRSSGTMRLIKKDGPRWPGDRRLFIFYCERCCEPSRYIEEWHVNECMECYVPAKMRGDEISPSVHPYSDVFFCCECHQSLQQESPNYHMSYAQTYDRYARPRVMCQKCNAMNKRHGKKLRSLIKTEIALRQLKRTAKEVYA